MTTDEKSAARTKIRLMTWRHREPLSGTDGPQRHESMLSENSAPPYEAAGNVNGAAEHLFEVEVCQHRLEMTPRAREAFECAGRAQRGVPYEKIQRHRANRRPLESCGDDPSARLEMADDVGDRGRGAHDVMGEVKQ